MKLNENTAISIPEVLLVPYDRRHVPRYHEWMKDPAIQEATASEPLSLTEEYENQASWRASHDKLTFILCQPTSAVSVTSGDIDTPEHMVGDINFFLHPEEVDEDGSEGVVGEVDIMIAGESDRGRGLGRAAAAGFLHWIWSNREDVMREYHAGEDAGGVAVTGKGGLGRMMAKIKADNTGSIALFRRLGFEQDGGVDYFGEIKMVLKDLESLGLKPEGYQVVDYHRAP